MIAGEPLSDSVKRFFRVGSVAGHADGRLEGEVTALLQVLAARALAVTPEQRDAIVACRDIPRLERWISHAITVRSVTELLSSEHDAVAGLFRARPELVLQLLRRVGLAAPAKGLAVLESTVAIGIPNFHVDLALLLGDSLAHDHAIVLLDVQITIDEDRPFYWLLYQAAAQARHRCSVIVLVIAPDRHVAEWASVRRPLGATGSYAPVVIGPNELRALAEVAVPTRAHLLDFVSARAVVRPDRYQGEPLSERGKGYYRDGVVAGRAEGRAEGSANALLRILAARSAAVTEKQRATILSCRDLAQLERWISRAVTAGSVADVLTE